jgi:integrase
MAEAHERRARLTKRFVDALRTAERDEVWWDTDQRGFAVRVWPSGQKTFFIRYRNREGRLRKLTLGRYGALTVDQARTIAGGRMGDVARGGDPAEDRVGHRASVTVAQLCADYQIAMTKGLVLGRKGEPKKASTVYVDIGRISRHIIPLLGNRKAKEVTTPDITRFRDAVASGETAADVKTQARGRAIVRGGKGTATRTLGLLGSIFQHGVRKGSVVHNPVRGVEKFAYRRKKALLTPDQYRILGVGLTAIAGEERHNKGAAACIRLIALTGLRLGEAQGLRWKDVDISGRMLRLGESKTGESVRPLGQAACELLRSLPRQGQFVFPAATGERHSQAVPKFWREKLLPKTTKIAEENGLEPLDGLDRHALRHSFAGMAEELGMTLPTIAAMLGHSLGGVTAGYVLKRLDATLIASSDRVSSRIDAMMRGRESEPVISFVKETAQ